MNELSLFFLRFLWSWYPLIFLSLHENDVVVPKSIQTAFFRWFSLLFKSIQWNRMKWRRRRRRKSSKGWLVHCEIHWKWIDVLWFSSKVDEEMDDKNENERKEKRWFGKNFDFFRWKWKWLMKVLRSIDENVDKPMKMHWKREKCLFSGKERRRKKFFVLTFEYDWKCDVWNVHHRSGRWIRRISRRFLWKHKSRLKFICFSSSFLFGLNQIQLREFSLFSFFFFFFFNLIEIMSTTETENKGKKVKFKKTDASIRSNRSISF